MCRTLQDQAEQGIRIPERRWPKRQIEKDPNRDSLLVEPIMTL